MARGPGRAAFVLAVLLGDVSARMLCEKRMCGVCCGCEAGTLRVVLRIFAAVVQTARPASSLDGRLACGRMCTDCLNDCLFPIRCDLLGLSGFTAGFKSPVSWLRYDTGAASEGRTECPQQATREWPVCGGGAGVSLRERLSGFVGEAGVELGGAGQAGPGEGGEGRGIEGLGTVISALLAFLDTR